MTDFSQIMTRAGVAGDLPQQLAQDLVLSVLRESALLSLARKVPTRTLDSRIPVLDQLPEAYWVSGDSGLKGTTKATFVNKSIIASEVAAVCPIPQAVLDDSQFPIWESVKPLLARACAKKLDDAGIWGIDPPMLEDGTTPAWSPSIVATANAAGAHTPFTDDPIDGLLNAAILVSSQGYNATGALVGNGWEFRASAARAQAVVANPADGPYPLSVAGMGIKTRPLVWHPANADAIVVDWENVVVGMRSDIQIQVFDSGVISDDAGKVILNLLQQDAVAARVVMRVGVRVLTPPTDVLPADVGLNSLTPAAFVAPHA